MEQTAIDHKRNSNNAFLMKLFLIFSAIVMFAGFVVSAAIVFFSIRYVNSEPVGDQDVEAEAPANDELNEEIRAAFEGRRRDTNEFLLERTSEEYAAVPIPKAKRSVADFKPAALYVAKFGRHLKVYSSSQPAGSRMAVRMYLPNDLPADARVPCVLVAPAGSNLLTGNHCDDLAYTAEILPYLEAGMAVVHYSIDGPPVDKQKDEETQFRMLAGSFRMFAMANGGVVNGQRALDFAIENFPQIDKQKIYCAGHSSAGTLSLQLASTDQRIAKCVAYAPAPSLDKRFAELLSRPDINRTLPMLKQYVAQWSPANRVDKFHCPTFIFSARDDANTPYSHTKEFCDQLNAAGKSVKLVSSERGGHYQSMIDTGIPAAIRWLKSESK